MPASPHLDWITPDWPAPQRVRAYSTSRSGGVSGPPFDSLNLAEHVGDDMEKVTENRARLNQALDLPAEPVWLKQVHGARVVDAAGVSRSRHPAHRAVQGCTNVAGGRTPGATDISTSLYVNGTPEADGSYTSRPGIVCAALTADCLPLLLCDEQGSRVAAVHVGWRGLAAGVIEAALQHLGNTRQLMAWLGPAIGPYNFEVGGEVRELFVAHDAEANHAFRPSPAGRWLADLYQLARQRLNAQGVTRIYGGGWCTHSDSQRFYSYRRDGVTGRMATLIWLETGEREKGKDTS
jgi:hypothetical protein